MWKMAKLGELMKIARGGSPRPIKSYITNDEDGVNWIKIGDTEEGVKYIQSTKEKIKRSGISRSRYVTVGDFLLSNSMSFGRPYILQIDGCIHDGWLVLSSYESHFVADYLYYLLSSSVVKNQFETAARGSTVSNLNIELVSNVGVSYPPLAEQQRIVAKLDAAFTEIDEIIGQTEKKIHHAKLLMQKTIDENIKGESSDMLQVKLDEFCDIKHGFAFDGKSFSVSDDESKPIVLTPGNFAENGTTKFNDKNTKRLQIEYDKKLLFSLDDLVVVMTDLSSKMPLLGKPAFIKQSDILHNQRIGLVKNNEQIIVNDYLYFYFRTSNYLNGIKKTASGTMVRHTAPNRIVNNTITAPKSLAEQRAISSKITMSLSKSENLIDIYKTKVSNLLSLKSAILAEELQSEAA